MGSDGKCSIDCSFGGFQGVHDLKQAVKVSRCIRIGMTERIALTLLRRVLRSALSGRKDSNVTSRSTLVYRTGPSPSSKKLDFMHLAATSLTAQHDLPL